jgi:monoamine oxidase
VRIVVIGAGLAGLAAAERLAGAGADVEVLEARDRVGGRVWSDRLANGAIIERGGEFITAGYEATERCARRLGLELGGMGIDYPNRELVGGPAPDRAALEHAAAALAAAAAARPEAKAEEILATAPADPDAKWVMGARVQSALAYPIAKLPTAALAEAAALLGTIETRRVTGGNDGLARGLAARLPRAVRLGTAARAIEHDERGVVVRADGGELAADACVVSVPVSLLPAIRFAPELQGDLLDRCARVPMSSAAKLAVALAEPHAPRALMSAGHRFWAWTTTGDGIGARSVGAWAGAAPVLDGLAVAEGPGRWLELLGAMWPALALDPTDLRLTTWDGDPWSRGAYSVTAAGPPLTGPEAMHPAARIWLAGEHLAGDMAATMEGALRSGEAAAARLLAAVPAH